MPEQYKFKIRVMNKRTVLDLLKPKAKMLGFSRKELAHVADTIMAALPEDIDEADEESSINQKIDEYLPLLRVGQAAASRQAAASTRRAKVDDDLDDDSPDDDDLDDEPTGRRHNRRGHRDDDDDFADAPRWAKRLVKMFEQGSESNVRRRAKVEALVEDLGDMGKHFLRDFDRHSFRSEDEWEDYLADLKDEVRGIENEMLDKRIEPLTLPHLKQSVRRHRIGSDEEMSDEEVISLAKGE